MNPDADRAFTSREEPTEPEPLCDRHVVPVLMKNVNRGGFPEFVCPECEFDVPEDFPW